MSSAILFPGDGSPYYNNEGGRLLGMMIAKVPVVDFVFDFVPAKLSAIFVLDDTWVPYHIENFVKAAKDDEWYVRFLSPWAEERYGYMIKDPKRVLALIDGFKGLDALKTLRFHTQCVGRGIGVEREGGVTKTELESHFLYPLLKQIVTAKRIGATRLLPCSKWVGDGYEIDVPTLIMNGIHIDGDWAFRKPRVSGEG